MSSIEKIIEYFHNELWQSPTAREYILSRGLTEESIRKYKIGYCPSSSQYCTRFHDRIIFPIWGTRNDLVGWTGRTLLNADAKYLNTKESAVFKKNRLLYLYNFAKSSIFETQTAILTEGQFDALMLHQSGITTAVASSGTSSFKLAAACTLARYARRVYIAFDGDAPGVKAATAAQKHLADVDVEGMIVSFPEGEDPASFLLKNGKRAFLELLYDTKQRHTGKNS